MNTKKTPLDSFDKSTSGAIFDVVKTEDLRHVYELGADSSADDRSAKHVTVSYIDAGRWIHGRTLHARQRNFCSVISEFALPQVAHSQGPPPECSLLICRSLARTTRHARHVTTDTSRTARHGHAKFPVGGHPLRSCITPPTSDIERCLKVGRKR